MAYRDYLIEDDFSSNTVDGYLIATNQADWGWDVGSQSIRTLNVAETQKFAFHANANKRAQVDYEFDTKLIQDVNSNYKHLGAFLQAGNLFIAGNGYRIFHLFNTWGVSRFSRVTSEGALLETAISAGALQSNPSLAVGETRRLRVVFNFSTKEGSLYGDGVKILDWSDPSCPWSSGRPGYFSYGCIAQFDNFKDNRATSQPSVGASARGTSKFNGGFD